MLKKITYIFFVIVFLSNTAFAENIKEKVEEAITNSFNKKVTYEMIKYKLPKDLKTEIEKECRQRFFREQVFIWKIKEAGKPAGFAILDNVYGKSLPITFLVIFDTEGKIISSKIIKYREPYGGAVRSENWNKQFKGKDAESSYKIGQEIDGISGATISVRSVTAGIKKLTLLISKIKGEL